MIRPLFWAHVALAFIYESMFLVGLAHRIWMWPWLLAMFGLQCFIVYCDLMSGAFLRKESSCSN